MTTDMLARVTAATRAAMQRRRAQRAEFAARRKAGLHRRHRTKLQREKETADD